MGQAGPRIGKQLPVRGAERFRVHGVVAVKLPPDVVDADQDRNHVGGVLQAILLPAGLEVSDAVAADAGVDDRMPGQKFRKAAHIADAVGPEFLGFSGAAAVRYAVADE